MARLRITLHVSFAIVVLLFVVFSSRPASAHGRSFASKSDAIKAGCQR